MIELAAAIRAGELSPVAVTDHYLRRTQELNDQVGAFFTVTAELAADQARAAEKAVHHGGGQGGAAAADRRADPDQGPEHGRRGPADARLGRVRGQRARHRRLRGGRDQAGRRGHHRQDGHPRVRAALLHRDRGRAAGPDAVGPVQVRGRVERRRGRRGRGGPGARPPRAATAAAPSASRPACAVCSGSSRPAAGSPRARSCPTWPAWASTAPSRAPSRTPRCCST